MATALPISVQMGALPATVKWTPQQLADAIAARMSLVSAQTFALFVTGSTAPTSDVGPWLKNGTEWYVWDSGTGAYVPISIDPASLGYFIGSAAPDETIYAFWIETTVGGSPLALKIYYSGAWVDVYATTLSGYLTIAAAAAGYQPLNANLTTLVSSTLGDVIYASAANTLSKLSGNTTANKQFLTQTGTGAVSAAPAWAAIIASDIPDISATYLTVAAAAATYFTIANGALKAPLASPALTGTPTAPTAAPGTNTTQLASTAFVTAAIAAIPGVTIVAGQGIFRASPSADQDIVHGGAGTSTDDVNFGTEEFDPDGAFAANVFTAPANGYYEFQATLQLSLQAGAPTDVDCYGKIVSSGGTVINMSGRDGTGTGQQLSTGSGIIQMTTGQTVKVQAVTTVDAAATVRINSGGSFFSGTRIR